MELKDKRGRLTSYGLACGYVETKADGPLVVTLWREHGAYHVRARNERSGRRAFWESFRLLADARKHYAHARAFALATAEAG